jgi:hypothetical protein
LVVRSFTYPVTIGASLRELAVALDRAESADRAGPP